MDLIVRQSMAKWPNVPHCYGWLGLDARGAWRMRDERAQHLGLMGDRITHAALRDFIGRNYSADQHGRWYFQNGPQRVFVNLEATPFIARTDPGQGLLLHTGAPLGPVSQVFLSDAGQMIFQTDACVAQLDDRDLVAMLAHLTLDGAPAADETVLAWFEGQDGALTLQLATGSLAVARIACDGLAKHFGFVRAPLPD